MAQAASKRLVTEATLPELVQDMMSTFLVAGTNITKTYDDTNNTLTISSANTTDQEIIRDTVGAALVAGTNISISVNDAADTITLSVTSHTHPSSQISDATTVGRSLMTVSDANGIRSIAGSAPIAGVEGLVAHDGTTAGGTRPSGYFRVRWVGGTTRPTNMVSGDVWERDA